MFRDLCKAFLRLPPIVKCSCLSQQAIRGFSRTCCSSCVRAFLAPARLCSMAVNVSFGLPLERFESLDPLVEQGYMFLILLEKGGALVGLRDVGLHRAR